jgi:uncharacterized protein (DUF1684 family)
MLRLITSARLFIPAIAAIILAGCATAPPAPKDWTDWQARRNESIGGTNGWTTLVGLHWLKEGDNSAGRAATNQAVLRAESVPGFIGVFTRQGKEISFTAAEGVDARVNGVGISKIQMNTDATSNPTKLKIGEVSIIAIQRGERIGLRVRDPDSETRRHFKGLHYFPYDPAWRLDAKFVAFPTERVMRVLDVTGATQEMASPGSVVFTVKGVEHRLDVVQEEPGATEFFIIFHDETAGKSTYHAGRFLYAAKPGADGRMVLDFNRAFTPPCGFTAYATCPLPPKQNWLPIAVRAGELKPPGHH